MKPWIETWNGCYTCKFWKGDRSIYGSSAYGECKRYPPTYIESKYSKFPETHGSEWCGEYIPEERKETKTTESK